jgi:hypothetical protein
MSHIAAIINILTLVVYPQHFDLPSCHVLYLSFKLSEMTEDLMLGLHEVDPGLPGEVINEGHIIRSALH